MVYLLAVIGAIAVAYLLWRSFGPDRVSAGSRRKRGVGPDDDPEFLRKLAEQAKRHPEDGNPPG